MSQTNKILKIIFDAFIKVSINKNISLYSEKEGSITGLLSF